MEIDKIDNIKIKRLNNNVRFEKKNKILLTDKAIQYVKNDVIYLNGNTKMINNLDTLTCDSMIYWSEIDSIYAIGNIQFVNGSKRGIKGELMEISYKDSLIEIIKVIDNAFAYNNLNLQINNNGPFLKFRDEMASKKMIALFKNDYISKIKLFNMASTLYHVLDDSILAGSNSASGDTILIEFEMGNINRIQIHGGGKGKFNPEKNNSKIDTTIFYGGEHIDYYIDKELTYITDKAFMEYQNTKLSAGKIIANWQSNILDAFNIKDQQPTLQTIGEAPMSGNNMIFDLVAKHGRIIKGKTSFDNGIYHGKEVFRDDPNVFHVSQSKYTSCELDNPHFYLGSKKMKLLPKDRVIAKPLWLYIYDIPIIGLPIAVFPNKGGKRHSGWIMPSFDSYNSIGTGFRNFGYFWAPNDYMDEKIIINFFDEEGFHINSNFRYKRKSGPRWYNFQYDGNIIGTIKRKLSNSNEILDLNDNENYREDQRLSWTHNQRFDPTQRLAIKYEFVSNKDAYQNNQEVNLQNRLKQNLSSSFNYSKNWKTSSIAIGFNQFRDLSIENSIPNLAGYLNQGRYKPYKYFDGPKLNYRLGTRKIFGAGDNWFNSLTASYTMKAKMGRKDYWLIRETDSTWSKNDTINLNKGGIKHAANFNAPQTYYWLKINPALSIKEDWIFYYTQYNNNIEEEIYGFKRRLTWNSSISANTKIYGLLPITIGRLNAIRHIITPSIRFQYQPNFSNPKWGGNIYFQNGNTNHDYFRGTYVGNTSTKQKKVYSLSVSNDLQSKIKQKNDVYEKSTFLSMNSSISYDALKDSLNFSEISSNIRIKNLGGSELFYIRMSHSIYTFDQINKNPTNKIVNIFNGERLQLMKIDVSTDMKLKLSGLKNNNFLKPSKSDTLSNINNNIHSNNNIWESKLQFRYSTNWKYDEEKWDYNFTLKTINSINLSKKWAITYVADFNLKDKQLIYHNFKIYRPLHCWEFSFNYWPRGGSAGFSLKINVKNPDLQDIKITSKSSNRGFGGF